MELVREYVTRAFLDVFFAAQDSLDLMPMAMVFAGLVIGNVVSANMIPVISLEIPGNFAAVFIILAVESVSSFTLGPSVFRFTEIKVIEDFGTVINKDFVIAFTIFTLMIPGNLFNWTVGGWYLLRSPLALFFLAGAVAVIVFSARRNSRTTHCANH